MNITIEKFEIVKDKFRGSSRFWVTLKDEQGYNKTINVDCSDTVKNVWKIDDEKQLFRALYPLLKKEIKKSMNKGILTVAQLPNYNFSSLKIPKYPPNESLSLPDTFGLSDTKTNQHLQEKLTESDSLLMLEPNFYGIGIRLNILISRINKKIEHITRQFSGLFRYLRRLQSR